MQAGPLGIAVSEREEIWAAMAVSLVARAPDSLARLERRDHPAFSGP